jgi:hypothetical protein
MPGAPQGYHVRLKPLTRNLIVTAKCIPMSGSSRHQHEKSNDQTQSIKRYRYYFGCCRLAGVRSGCERAGRSLDTALHAYRGSHHPAFRGAYNQSDAQFYARPLSNKERWNIEDFGFSGRDPSRVGGEDAWLHPGG